MHRLRRRIEELTGPPWPRWVRLALILVVVTLWAACYYFRLTSAREFAVIAYGLLAVMLVVKRTLWKRSLQKQ